MVLESELRIAVLDSYKALQDALHNLQACLQNDNHLISWVQDTSLFKQWHLTEANTRTKAFSIINQLEYLPQQAPREIIICAGFIGASHETLEAVNVVNLLKDNFKKHMLTLKSAKIPLDDAFLCERMENILGKRPIQTKQVLKKMGLTRLHLKQCYRKLPLLKTAPVSISWTWANTRSIKRVSQSKAAEMLKRRGNDYGIQAQLSKLYTLSEKEPLAIIQELAPHLRANIVLSGEKESKNRCMVKGPVPIFFPSYLGAPLPRFKPPGEKKGKNKARPTRADMRIDPSPFLPAIHAHRYLNLT